MVCQHHAFNRPNYAAFPRLHATMARNIFLPLVGLIGHDYFGNGVIIIRDII